MLTHPRYGMGKRLVRRMWTNGRCSIGQNCDQWVPMALVARRRASPVMPRLTTQRKAWDVLSDFCSAMRCMPGMERADADVRAAAIRIRSTCSRSNVVMPDDGAPFRYSFSALKDRHNAVEVNWIDPDNGWETATRLVEDARHSPLRS